MSESQAEIDSLRDQIRHYPALSFWYGLGYSDIDAMPRYAIREYMDALPRLQASHESLLYRASAYPHLTEAGQSASINRLNAVLSQNSGEKLPTERLMSRLASVGISPE